VHGGIEVLTALLDFCGLCHCVFGFFLVLLMGDLRMQVNARRYTN
jgi:hypothetical protein